MSRFNKEQQARLIDPELRALLEALPDDAILAVHDLTHDQMEIRHGTNRREKAHRAAERERDALKAEVERLREALREGFCAMSIANALPGVSAEYDFLPAIGKARAALNHEGERG